ncbi:MAG: CPBP family intramembrane metalloprotease [Lachnospiraceae bacterium]|nr:CPBP family intramembrane metalloprotease [Lachnospiraceae bacterium]
MRIGFAFSVGLFLGYVYCRTGKVIITMIMHAVTNGLGSVVMLLIPMMENGGDENIGIVLALLAAILVILIMMISGFVLLYRWIKQKRFHPDNSMSTCIPQNEVVKTIYFNPGVILFYTLCIIAIVMDLFNIEMPSF